MKYLNMNEEGINDFPKRYRANLINSLGGFKSVVLIGTKDNLGEENLAIFSSLFHLGANPALCGLVVRPSNPSRNTLGNILNFGEYTINHIHEGIYQQAHQSSAKYPEGVNEFKVLGLTQQHIEGVNAPFVAESRVKFACDFVQKMDIELNDTMLIIGKIKHIIVPEEIIKEDGFLEIEKAGTLTCNGLDSYFRTEKIGRFSYAQPNKPLEFL
jgi:flavin reductase (DIM6/NTAB) family NADH-FMN oxidoreductase RutF